MESFTGEKALRKYGYYEDKLASATYIGKNRELFYSLYSKDKGNKDVEIHIGLFDKNQIPTSDQVELMVRTVKNEWI